MHRRSLHLPILLSFVTVLTGCGDMDWNWGKKEEPAPNPGTTGNLASFTPETNYAALDGTVGTMTYVQGLRGMRLRGYGLVVGLNGKGSRGGPPSVRDYILKEIRRVREANKDSTYELTAEQWVDNLDTAIVGVECEVPFGARRGTIMDVFVTALDPDTQSLIGGRLLGCDLKIFNEVSPAEVIAGRTHARAEGPLFINPFISAADDPGSARLREAKVIGGAINLEDRRLTLITIVESYATVSGVMDVINDRFHGYGDNKVADAVSPTNINLNVPAAYHGREQYFMNLVMHLPYQSSRAIEEARMKKLMGELADPSAPIEDVTLALEGVGQSIKPMLRELYDDVQRPRVSYYAARTGMRLDDFLALDVVIRHAKDPGSPYRRQAVRELGQCQGKLKRRAASALMDILSETDPLIRVVAFESLRQVDPGAIRTIIVGPNRKNFAIEIVPSTGEPLIYGRRTGTRRLALIGGDRMKLQPPMLYADAGRPVVVSAREGDDMITVIRKDNHGVTVLEPARLPLDVPAMIEFLGGDPEIKRKSIRGLGVNYDAMIHLLHQLCAKRAVNATFQWEEQSIEELVGPLQPMGRPESEL